MASSVAFSEVYVKEFETVAGPPLFVRFCRSSVLESFITFNIEDVTLKFSVADLLQLREQMDSVLGKGDQDLEQLFDDGWFGIRGQLRGEEQAVTFYVRKGHQTSDFQFYNPMLLRDETEMLELINDLFAEPSQTVFDKAFALILFNHIHTDANERKAARWLKMSEDDLKIDVLQIFELHEENLRSAMVKICKAFSIPDVAMVEGFTPVNLLEALKSTLTAKAWRNTHLRKLFCKFSKPLHVFERN